MVAIGATVILLGALAWMWQASLVPNSYSVMAMGFPDYGGAPGDGGHSHPIASGDGKSVRSLSADPHRPADVRVTLTARAEEFALASGRRVDGYTFNGQSPGPAIHAAEGELVEVRLVNESVPAGVALHWHGVDVPNASDGVAGVTQDAVAVGGAYTYRFVADQPGSYWYHSHQVSHEQVRRGLFGEVIVAPKDPSNEDVDVSAVVHRFAGIMTINGREGEVAVDAEPGDRVRVRVINTENGPTPAWVSGAAYRLVAVDGRDLNAPTSVTDAAVLITAGGRADLEIIMPDDGAGVRVHVGGVSSIVLGFGTRPPSAPRPRATLDLLHYGKPAALGFDPGRADRQFRYEIGRRPGFLDGKPGMWWTINGKMFPDVPMYVVAEGDVVLMRIRNGSGEVHPMHLHGHHAVVLSRNGVRSTGSPWWVDSLNVGHGEMYDIAFVADNPGIWMDHCHNLPHVREGLTAHLMYEGVTTPYVVGGSAVNVPE